MTNKALCVGIGVQARHALSYSALARRLQAALAESNYDQEPQLEGRPSFKRRQVFT
jgi:hypothetical protein